VYPHDESVHKHKRDDCKFITDTRGIGPTFLKKLIPLEVFSDYLTLEYRYQEENVGVSLTDLTPPHNNIIIV
jgi:hypothetical protein